MKNIYTLFLFTFLLLSFGCSKDVLKQYDKRIVGTWRISAVNRIGIGGDTDNLPFREGNLTFKEDGTLVYELPSGVSYQGSWDIRRSFRQDDDVQRILQVTVVNFNTQEILTEYYDDMLFMGTDYFRATINTNFRTYITHFRR